MPAFWASSSNKGYRRPVIGLAILDSEELGFTESVVDNGFCIGGSSFTYSAATGLL